MGDIAVVYICRGEDPNFRQRVSRFVRSWLEHPPGIGCHLYVIYKEFNTVELLAWAVSQMDNLNPTHIMNYIPWNSWGGGCFLEACNHVAEQLLCTLVSTTEIMHDNWLAKLYAAFSQPNTGLVGCTGSHIATLHIRDTAIIVRTGDYVPIAMQFDFTESKDGYLDFEHGPNNFTQQILRSGKKIWVVEADKIIGPEAWPVPTTYQGNLHNVLVHDRGARDFNDL